MQKCAYLNRKPEELEELLLETEREKRKTEERSCNESTEDGPSSSITSTDLTHCLNKEKRKKKQNLNSAEQQKETKKGTFQKNFTTENSSYRALPWS